MAKYKKEGPRKEKWLTRRAEALVRQEYWENLTPTQQLNNLDKRLGWQYGAAKQRARIIKNASESYFEEKKSKKGKVNKKK